MLPQSLFPNYRHNCKFYNQVQTESVPFELAAAHFITPMGDHGANPGGCYRAAKDVVVPPYFRYLARCWVALPILPLYSPIPLLASTHTLAYMHTSTLICRHTYALGCAHTFLLAGLCTYLYI